MCSSISSSIIYGFSLKYYINIWIWFKWLAFMIQFDSMNIKRIQILAFFEIFVKYNRKAQSSNENSGIFNKN